MNSTAGRILGWVVAVAIGSAIFIGLRSWRASSASSDVREQMLEAIRATDCHAADSAYAEQIFSAAHDSAFDECYKPGGRRKRSEFNGDLYTQKVLSAMAEKARADGRSECFQELVVMRAVAGWQ